MRKGGLFIFIVFFNFLINAQIVDFKVINYSVNGVVQDGIALNEDLILSFYNCIEDLEPLCFATFSRRQNKTLIYGLALNMKTEHYPETEKRHENDVYKFHWMYTDNLTGEEGNSMVVLTKIYIEDVAKFEAKIVDLNTNSVKIYKGYLEQ